MELSEQQSQWLQDGMDNFNTNRFWHAHEDWEELWKSLKPNSSQELIDGVQGIIQIAAMLLNHQRRKARGVTNLWTKASAKLEPVMEVHSIQGDRISVLLHEKNQRQHDPSC